MNNKAVFLVTHGSRDRRSWLALQNLLAVARSLQDECSEYGDRYISGGCLEGLDLSLAQQLSEFADEIIKEGIKEGIQECITEIVILPLFLLEGIHVSEDIPEQVEIAQNKFLGKLHFRTIAHLGTNPQIPDLLLQQFEKYTDIDNAEKTARILVSHGSRLAIANHVVEELATHSQAIAAYWGVEPKIETQIENLLSQGINKINLLPYFLNEGGITETIANKLKPYSDRATMQMLPVPLSNEQIINLALGMI